MNLYFYFFCILYFPFFYYIFLGPYSKTLASDFPAHVYKIRK